jgi:hypothetical protein
MSWLPVIVFGKLKHYPNNSQPDSGPLQKFLLPGGSEIARIPAYADCKIGENQRFLWQNSLVKGTKFNVN